MDMPLLNKKDGGKVEVMKTPFWQFHDSNSMVSVCKSEVRSSLVHFYTLGNL